jgi:hypothetical protein
MRKSAQEKDIGFATAQNAVQKKAETFPIQNNSDARIETGGS